MRVQDEVYIARINIKLVKSECAEGLLGLCLEPYEVGAVLNPRTRLHVVVHAHYVVQAAFQQVLGHCALRQRGQSCVSVV